MQLYGNTPLIEYDELKIEKRAGDIVLAIDTSGSCSGEIMTRFISETLALLRDITAGGRQVKTHVMWCDCKLQGEVIIGEREEFIRDYEPSGFGGTDFRPVFERIRQLRESGLLPRMPGLIYFSDGCGVFPDSAPDYETAFVMPKEDCSFMDVSIPSWVTKVRLEKSELSLK